MAIYYLAVFRLAQACHTQRAISQRDLPAAKTLNANAQYNTILCPTLDALAPLSI